MRRLAYRLYCLVSTTRHWAMRRLMPGGWIVLTGLVLTAGIATDAEQALGYQAFGLLLCIAFVSIVSAPFFRVRFNAERTLPRFGTAGEPFHYSVTIRNGERTTQTGLFVMDGLADPRPTYEEFLRAGRPRLAEHGALPWEQRVSAPKTQPLPAMLPAGEASVDMRLIPYNRGVLHFGSIALARPDPFMLFRALTPVPAPAAVTILPRRYPLPNLALPGASRYQRGGVAFASSVGESEEFVSLRDYRHGDPPRRIHWRSWAKVGRPVVKEYQDEFFVRHALILDTFTKAENVAVFEEAVSIAASLACTIDTQESLLDLMFVGPQAYCFTAGHGVAQADQMLEILASVQTCADKPFGALEQIVIEHSAAVSGCICIFVNWDDARLDLVRKLEALDVPLLLLLVREEKSPELDTAKIAIRSPVHQVRVGRIAEDLSAL